MQRRRRRDAPSADELAALWLRAHEAALGVPQWDRAGWSREG